MFSFFKNVLSSLTALAIFFILIPIVFLMTLISALVSTALKEETKDISEDGVYVIDVSENIEEFARIENNFNFSLTPPMKNESTFRLCGEIIDIALFKQAKAVLIKGCVSQSNATLAQIAEIREAFSSLKGKIKIYAYLENPNVIDYYLASVADEIIMNPFSSFELNGLSTNSPYLGAALKKYGIEADVVRSGSHKSFGDIFTKSKMSEDDRQILSGVINSIWNSILEPIAQSRKCDSQKLKQFADNTVMCDAQTAKKLGFIDSLMYADEFIKYMQSAYGESGKTYKKWSPPQEIYPQDGDCAIVYMRGNIVDAPLYLNDEITPDRYVPILRKLRDNKDIKAVILRIDSGGGSAYASEIIRREVELLAKEKPVVASFGGTAASGAYWIATAASSIYLDAETITGSIGVFSIMFSFEDFAKSWGVDFDGVKTSNYADIYRSTRKKTPNELAIIKKSVDEIYERFVKLVAQSRKLDIEEVKKIADGRIFSGKEAVELKLADGIATLNQVVAALGEEQNSWNVVEYPQIDKIKEFFENMEKGYSSPRIKLMPQKMSEYANLLKHLSTYSDRRGIYTVLPLNTSLTGK